MDREEKQQTQTLLSPCIDVSLPNSRYSLHSLVSLHDFFISFVVFSIMRAFDALVSLSICWRVAWYKPDYWIDMFVRFTVKWVHGKCSMINFYYSHSVFESSMTCKFRSFYLIRFFVVFRIIMGYIKTKKKTVLYI